MCCNIMRRDIYVSNKQKMDERNTLKIVPLHRSRLTLAKGIFDSLFELGVCVTHALLGRG